LKTSSTKIDARLFVPRADRNPDGDHLRTAERRARTLHTVRINTVKEISKGVNLAILHAELFHAYSPGNFYAEKQNNNKVLPFGVRGSRNYARPCISIA